MQPVLPQGEADGRQGSSPSGFQTVEPVEGNHGHSCGPGRSDYGRVRAEHRTRLVRFPAFRRERRAPPRIATRGEAS